MGCRSGRDTIAELLLASGTIDHDSRDNTGRTPLSWAAGSGHDATVRVLLSSDAVHHNSRDNQGRTRLSWAAGSGHFTVVQPLLGTGAADRASKCDYGRTPLSWAVWCGHAGVVSLLVTTESIELEFDNTRHIKLLLMQAAWNGHEAVMKVLFKDANGRTPLSWAASSRKMSLVKLLLAIDSVDVNSTDNSGRTPL